MAGAAPPTLLAVAAFHGLAPCVTLPLMKHAAVYGRRRGDGTFVEEAWKRDA